MDKKTLFAVILSVVIIVGSMVVQNIFFPAKSKTAATAPESSVLNKAAEKSKGTVPGKAGEGAANTQENISGDGSVQRSEEHTSELQSH